MSNNNNNEKYPAVTMVVVSVAVLALGYFLFKTSPGSSNVTPSQNSSSMNNMHSQSSTSAGNSQLNSLLDKPIPDIQLSDKEGKTYTATDFKGKYTILFFNEGLMCYPGCWNQIASFGSDERFNSDQIQAISVVVDSPRDWQTAINKMPQLAKATMMFDANADTSRKLGMLTTASQMMGGTLPGHTYVVLDKDGIVRFVFDDPNMAIANEMLFNKIGELNGASTK